jgi:hypothetical protein
MPRVRQTEVRLILFLAPLQGLIGLCIQAHRTFLTDTLPLVDKRSTYLGQEFAFWATHGPAELGGVYEMRTYHLVCHCMSVLDRSEADLASASVLGHCLSGSRSGTCRPPDFLPGEWTADGLVSISGDADSKHDANLSILSGLGSAKSEDCIKSCVALAASSTRL